jgi:23S rRNA (adenine-N6)-dimethyltransferase
VRASAPRRRPRRRSWGWYRLEPDWAERIVSAAGVRPGDLVLDLGAGTGALTAPLVATGARVVAVELHHGRATRLRRFESAGVRVVEGDLLEVPLPRRPYRVVANPPFALGGPLLRRLVAPGSPLVTADLVLERAMVAYYCDGRRRRWERTWSVTRGPNLPRRALTPPPAVDVGVLRLRRR